MLAAVCEEVGWSGYVLEPVQNRRGALGTSLVIGVVWATWHVVPYLQVHTVMTWTAWQSLFTVAARVLMVWLCNNTGGSVLAAVLFHDMIDVNYALFPNFGSHYNPAMVGPITAIVAVLITFLWGARTLARYRYSASPKPIPLDPP